MKPALEKVIQRIDESPPHISRKKKIPSNGADASKYLFSWREKKWGE